MRQRQDGEPTDRRRFMGMVSVILAAPGVATGEQSQKRPRIGYLGFNTREDAKSIITAFREVLRERGWIEGQNLTIEYRFAEGDVGRLPALAGELVNLKVDVIAAASSASTRAAQHATQTIPIVMLASANAIGEGFVASLARPGGNITGMTFLASPEIAGKQLELLKEVVPTGSRFAVLTNPRNDSHAGYTRELKVAAGRLGAELKPLEARSPEQLDSAFAAMSKERASALLVLTDAMFLGQRRKVAQLAAKSGLPAMYSQREFVDVGGFLSYGPGLVDMSRRAAIHVDKILRGAKPQELPVEQPTKFEFVINRATAKALGITVPQALLSRADAFVE